ncbi:sialate O-acetylesterase [Algoriphagus jejuensis]|uniref:Sialate O-acetylesterase n=1 Tax=Algoriphagus jejuensis TaxID=419934 RepID=A0ABN1MYW6_9BACT
MTPKITLTVFLLFLFVLESNAQDLRTEFFPKAERRPNELPDKENTWVFVLAGQSNMAGRGQVEAIDTIPNPRILTINKAGDLLIAKEPLHFYEPILTGLDCGLSFGKELLNHVPDSISIVLIPTAVGGSAIGQWINDSTYRDVTLLSNFREKLEIGKQFGQIKGILWHQGETDAAKAETIEIHVEQLRTLFGEFRSAAGNPNLPILLGELGSFSKTKKSWRAINFKIRRYVKSDPNAYLIRTGDLNHKGDSVHFDSDGQREMGKRFGEKFIDIEAKSAPSHQ